MRDIEDYEQNYMIHGFEDYQVAYRRKKVLETLKEYPHRRILEIGCGMEPLFKYLDHEDYERYIVVEPGKEFYQNAMCLSAKNEKVNCINDYFAASEELKSGELDFIICSGLLHEVEDPIGLLENIVHICNKDTIVHINVPNANSFHRLLAKEMGFVDNVFEMSERNVLLQQHEVYDKKKFCNVVEAAGFKVIETGSYFLKPFTHKQMFEMLENHIIDENVLNGLYNITKYFPEYGSEIFVNAGIRESNI
ncbi:MAG: class I SAM-dependent methyltransferase [Lachnospiraceae bacterium]|nr:class I SAM-dependent methyltransferase [Lachnospiraceae bacterium]